eukprot:Skav212058  [mRNA]  locus=scaffold408:140868:148056:+ [translate_table: standard]
MGPTGSEETTEPENATETTTEAVVVSTTGNTTTTSLANTTEAGGGRSWGHTMATDQLLDLGSEQAVVSGQVVASVRKGLRDALAWKIQEFPLRSGSRDE